MRHVGLAVIGSGSGNLAIPDDIGESEVALIRCDSFGGTCVNRGCIPLKMFVYTAYGDAGARGVSIWPVGHPRGSRLAIHQRPGLQSRRRDLAEGTQGRTESATSSSTVDMPASPVLTNWSSTRYANRGGPGCHRHRRPPLHPPVVVDSGVGFETSDTVMRLESLPASMVILGGGYVAVEMAHVFSCLGVAIHVVESAPTLVATLDADISRRFTAEAAARWDVHLDATVTDIRGDGDKVEVVLEDGTRVGGELLLVATGRRPNTDHLGLESARILRPRRAFMVDEFGRAAMGVWALGDCSSDFELKHVANAEARVIAHNLTHPDDLRPLPHDWVPSAVFSDPQIASVGARSQDLEGRPYVEALQEYGHVAYGWALQDRRGVCKLYADPERACCWEHTFSGLRPRSSSRHSSRRSVTANESPILHGASMDSPRTERGRRECALQSPCRPAGGFGSKPLIEARQPGFLSLTKTLLARPAVWASLGPYGTAPSRREISGSSPRWEALAQFGQGFGGKLHARLHLALGQRLQLTRCVGYEGRRLLDGVHSVPTFAPDAVADGGLDTVQTLAKRNQCLIRIVLRLSQSLTNTATGVTRLTDGAPTRLRSAEGDAFGLRSKDVRLGVRATREHFLDLVHPALCAPPEGRRSFGVDGRQDEATEKAQVLQEVHSLLGSSGLIRLLPESVSGVRGGNEGAHQEKAGQPSELARGQEHASDDLDAAIDSHRRLGVQARHASLLGERLGDDARLGHLSRGIAERVKASGHEDRCEQWSGNAPRECHDLLTTRISELYASEPLVGWATRLSVWDEPERLPPSHVTERLFWTHSMGERDTCCPAGAARPRSVSRESTQRSRSFAGSSLGGGFVGGILAKPNADSLVVSQPILVRDV